MLLVVLILLALAHLTGGDSSIGPRYFNTPMHEIAQTELYLAMNDNHEVVVAYAGKGVDLKPNDYITHADGVRLLSGWPGGIQEFLESGEKEAVVPVVDDNDTKFGGHRLKGFMLLQAVQPRKLGSRRGEIHFDMEEGGPAPSMKLGNIVIGAGGAKSTADPSYAPPPRGGGACISHRDCYPVPGGGYEAGRPQTGGICTEGACSCQGDYTGSYCQLHRPEFAAISSVVKKAADAAGQASSSSSTFTSATAAGAGRASATAPPPPHATGGPVDTGSGPGTAQLDQAAGHNPLQQGQDQMEAGAANDRKRPPAPIKLSFGSKSAASSDSAAASEPTVPVPLPSGAPVAAPTVSALPTAATQGQNAGNSCTPTAVPTTPSAPTVATGAAATGAGGGEKRDREGSTEEQQQQQPVGLDGGQEGGGQDADGQEGGNQEGGQPGQKKGMRRRRKPGAGGTGGTEDGAPRRVVTGAGDVQDQQRAKTLTMDDLYGEGKAYPEPYNAGKLPNNLVHERYRKRYNRESFLYSVRFRVGPFGITFDNKITNGTVVQSLVRGEQAEQSDIKEGDQLIAVDHYNISDAPAKVTQRLMGSLSWPRVLVFQTRVTGPDPREKELQVRRRTFNMTVVYPPSLVGEYQFRLTEWAPALAPLLTSPASSWLRDLPAFAQGAKPPAFCPIYRIRAAADPFGCKAEREDELQLPGTYDSIVQHGGRVDPEVERGGQLLALLLQEAARRELHVEPRSLGMAKRGVCTFVQKAHALQAAGSQLTVVVNNANDLADIPAGKEKTDTLSVPIAIAAENDAILTHLAASNDNEIWAIVSEAGIPAAVQPAVAEPATPVPAAPAGKVGKGGRNTRAAAAAPKTKAPAVAAPVAQEVVYESGGMTAACSRVQALVEDIIDRFPHSVPPMESRMVLQAPPPDTSKVRGLTEEGGRLALSGQNGWAFFDYHLAMFGPQEVPLGPFRLQMAMPPFGCDPGAYSVRIQGTVVAILRGGGCSFGIKVINAQKLGAKAVIIVNTDDMKTMRLMALPDEVPLINIPCIMVSRRIQFYLEEQLRPYFPIDQHLVSIQPTGLFGDYEKKNMLKLPERLKIN